MSTTPEPTPTDVTTAVARLSNFSLTADERAAARDALQAAKDAEGYVGPDGRVADLNAEAGR